MTQAHPDDPRQPSRDSLVGWLHLQLATGLVSPKDLATTVSLAPESLADAASEESITEVVARVVADHQAQHPEPSADARALIAAAAGLTRAGVVVSLGEARALDDALAVARDRAQAARATGAIVHGVAVASATGIEDLVLTRELVLHVEPVPHDELSAIGAQIAATLSLAHATPETLGPRIADAFVDAGLPGRWDPVDQVVTVSPLSYGVPALD